MDPKWNDYHNSVHALQCDCCGVGYSQRLLMFATIHWFRAFNHKDRQVAQA